MPAFVLVTALLASTYVASAGPVRVELPAGASREGLNELLRDGEVALMPKHLSQPFNAVVVTSADRPCSAVAHSMMDVERWPELWNVKSVDVRERTPTRVAYEMHLNVILAPPILGVITRPVPGRVIFHDTETGAEFTWTLLDREGGCDMRYSLLETPGKPSGFVNAVKAIEPSATDAMNFAAAFSASRGYAKPEKRKARGTISEAGKAAWEALALEGTAMRVVRTGGKSPRIILRRIITRRAEDVLTDVLDRGAYDNDKVAILKSARVEKSGMSYSVGAFGGRVNFTTRTESSGDLDGDGVVVRDEVSGGDLPNKAGSWTWTVVRAHGGTDVTLDVAVDLVPGSAILSTLASTDPITNEGFQLHFGLALMGELVGGQPVGARVVGPRSVAKAP